MLKSTLVIQLLTCVLDSQGADARSVSELFPEEFVPRVQGADPASNARLPWLGASPDLMDSLEFLLERHLVEVTHEGRLVPGAPATPLFERFTRIDQEEGFGFVPVYDPADAPSIAPGHAEPFSFDEPRLED